jgi:biotin operon repressor
MHNGGFVPSNSSIYAYLCQFHRGKAYAVKAQVLADRFGISLRDVNEEIRILRKAGILIGALKERPFGYYLPLTEVEAGEYLSAFKHELFDMLETFNRQKRAKQVFIDSFHSPEPSGQLYYAAGFLEDAPE